MAVFVRLAAIAATVLFIGAVDRNSASALQPGDVFKDCEACPEMVVVAPGSFVMGSARRATEGPRREVRIARPFAIARYEVTTKQWNACVAAGGCVERAVNDSVAMSDSPAGGLSWHDARLYVDWLGRHTGLRYKIPSEAMWEYAARGGSIDDFWWGPTLGVARAHCRDCGSPFAVDRSAPVGSFGPNPFGLYDVAGNVWEWVEDCWRRGFDRAPSDGTSWLEPGCRLRVLRGGGWDDGAYMMLVTTRLGLGPGNSSRSNGLRVMREIERVEPQ